MSLINRFFIISGLLISFMGTSASANSCDSRLFSLNIESTPGSRIRVADVLGDLASTCKISVLYADNLTKSKLNQELDMFYVNDLTLNELLVLLLNEHDLFFSYDKALSRLKVAYIQTRSFNIDYINVTQMRTYSARDITVGASSNQNEDMMQFNGSQRGGSRGESGTKELVEYSSLGSVQQGSNTDFTSSKAISDFTFWDELKGQIDGMLQRDGDTHAVRSWSMVNRDAGIITVSGSYKQINRVEKYIKLLESRMHKQVMLETRILEVEYAEGEQIGVDWNKFQAGVDIHGFGNVLKSGGTIAADNAYFAGFDFTMEGMMNFLRNYGNVEVLSSPKVMTLNNQPALINVGDQLNYRYETGQVGAIGIGTPTTTTTYSLGSVFVGLSLTIIPEVTNDGHIILRINPVDSRVPDDLDGTSSEQSTTTTQTEDGIRAIPPDMQIKQLTSIVKVKDGSKVLVGGLVQKERYKIDNKVPVLGDIPILGPFFHSTETKLRKKEFFVVVVPTIIESDRFPTIEEHELIERTEMASFDLNTTKEQNEKRAE